MKKIELFFGIGKDRDGEDIRPEVREGALDELRYRAAGTFGGCTLLRSQGDWFSNRLGIVVTEPGAVLILFVSDTDEHRGVRPLVECIKGMLNQDSVYVVSSRVEAELL